jgi:serine/threonine-protein kinase
MLLEINPGTTIDKRYEIQKIIGQGGFGRTYLAHDRQRFGDRCVLKEFFSLESAEVTVQKSRELFEQEARVLYQINHPQIPKFLAWFTDNERLFIVQEYVDGKTYSQLLQERLARGNRAFSEAEVILWLKDMLPVLDYLHEMKIIHRDIALDNIMYCEKESKPVLIDFGLVKEKVSKIWSVGTILGKIGYSPPEQLRMGHSYPSSDLYALGVCAIVLLSGKMPKDLMDRSLEWQWHSFVNVDDSLEKILDKMLAEKPTQRYQSAKEILFEIDRATLSNSTEANLQLKKVQINIDKTKKELEVAQIVSTDEFRLLEQKANKLRHKNEALTEFHFKEQTPTRATFSKQSNTIISNTLTPEFLARCRQELTRYVGPFASFVLEDILEQDPQLTPSELIEALATEIPEKKRAQEFKNCLKGEGFSGSDKSY